MNDRDHQDEHNAFDDQDDLFSSREEQGRLYGEFPDGPGPGDGFAAETGYDGPGSGEWNGGGEFGGPGGPGGWGGGEPIRQGPPWEQPGEARFERYFETIVNVVTRPVQFFETLRTSGPIVPPLLFAVIGMTIGGIVTYLYGQVFEFSFHQFIQGYFVGQPGAPDTLAYGGRPDTGLIGHLVAIIFMPILTVLILLIQAGITHLLLTVFGKRTVGYDGTLRIYAYYQGTLAWLSLIPFCSDLIIMIWGTVLAIIGVERMHRCGMVWACIIVLTPIAAVCCAVMGCGVLLAMALA